MDIKSGLTIERILARKADAVITVFDGIADERERNLGVNKPIVVRNLPLWRTVPEPQVSDIGPLRRSLGIPPEIPIILYQDVIARCWGLPTLLNAMVKLSHPSAVLVLLRDRPMLP